MWWKVDTDRRYCQRCGSKLIVDRAIEYGAKWNRVTGQKRERQWAIKLTCPARKRWLSRLQGHDHFGEIDHGVYTWAITGTPVAPLTADALPDWHSYREPS